MRRGHFACANNLQAGEETARYPGLTPHPRILQYQDTALGLLRRYQFARFQQIGPDLRVPPECRETRRLRRLCDEAVQHSPQRRKTFIRGAIIEVASTHLGGSVHCVH